MSFCPNEWEIKKLKDVCTIEKTQGVHLGLPYVGMQDIESNTAKFIGSTEPKEVKSSSFLFANDHLLYGRLRPYLNKVFTPDFTGHCSTEIFPLKPSNKLRRRYLLYWFLMDSTVQAINETCTGARMPRANFKDVMNFHFPLPPLPEQQRIVSILDEVFEGVAKATANAEKNIANVHELFESYADTLLSSEKFSGEELTLGEMLKRNWITSHLDGNHGGNYPRKNEFIDHGIPYIAANCLKHDRIDFSKAKYLHPDRAALLKKGIAQNRDVLFAHNATVGPVAILRTDEEKVILGTSLTYYRCNEDHILPEYLAHFMRSPAFTEQYKSVMRQSTRNQVPITKQRTFTHIIPSIDAQRDMAAKLDDISNFIADLIPIYQKELTTLAELKQSILQKAFSGELTADSIEKQMETV